MGKCTVFLNDHGKLVVNRDMAMFQDDNTYGLHILTFLVEQLQRRIAKSTLPNYGEKACHVKGPLLWESLVCCIARWPLVTGAL